MDWEKINKLNAKEKQQLVKIEHKLFVQSSCTNEELQNELNVGQRMVEK